MKFTIEISDAAYEAAKKGIPPEKDSAGIDRPPESVLDEALHSVMASFFEGCGRTGLARIHQPVVDDVHSTGDQIRSALRAMRDPLALLVSVTKALAEPIKEGL